MKVLLICNYKPSVGGISGQVELLQKHLQEEGHVADIFSTKASVVRRLMLPWKLRSMAHSYDVLHIHCCSGWGFIPAVLGITVGRRLKKRIVLTYHGGGGERFFDKHARLVHRYLTRTNANIVLSGFLAQVFEKHQLPYTIIPNIIELDDKQFRLRETLKPNYICTRAHEPLYNIPCILRSFQKVLTELPESTLTLVGDGSQHAALEKLTKEMGLTNVTFTGRVDNNEIYQLLDKADILLSAPTVDNMPVSLLEAMNAGLLVISSRVGGVAYMIEDGTTGLLFESDNHHELAQKMLGVFKNQTSAKTIIQQAHQAVSAYSWMHIKDKLYSIYGILA